MNAIIAHIESHSAEYTAILGLLAVAVIANMPQPGASPTWSTAYKWLYDSLQAFVAARNPRPPEAHIVTSQENAQGASSKSDATFPVNTTNSVPIQPK